MIKEKKKRKNYKKTKKQIVLEYLRTVLFSVIFATIVTTCLTIKARNEMIENIYAQGEIQQKIDREHAIEIITKENLLKDLKNKNYSVCMNVGELYEAAGDYKDAQRAYELAIQKAKPGAYKPYYKLLCVLVEQEKFDKANSLLNNLKDFNSKSLIKFKTRSYITMGDKYYSIGKFLSAAKTYEKANFYYLKFSKRDSVIEESIKNRIVNSYVQVADLMVKSGLNSDAVRFLKKAESYSPKDYKIRYKLAIVLSDSDPEKSVKYLDSLLDEIPQEIDYGIYGTALMKAANIADLDNRPTQAKLYRYKIHSIDEFINRKVVYSNDIETTLESYTLKKVLFTYPLKMSFRFSNVSPVDIINLTGDFVLTSNNKPLETITLNVANKNKPLFSNGFESNLVNLKFKRKIFTKRELDTYTVKIYLYKDPKYKTLVSEIKLPSKSLYLSKY